jgi:hypothetical protein
MSNDIVPTELKTQREIIDLVQLLTTDDETKRLNPDRLTKDDKDMIIEYLRYNENLSYSRIAYILNMHTTTVTNHLDKVDKYFRMRVLATGIDPYVSVAELRRVKNVIQQKAAQKQDWGLVWKSELDEIQAYHALGLFKTYKTDPNESDVVDAEFVNKVKQSINGNIAAIAPPGNNHGSQSKIVEVSTETKVEDSNGNFTAKDLRLKLEEVRSGKSDDSLRVEERKDDEKVDESKSSALKKPRPPEEKKRFKRRSVDFGTFFKSRKVKKASL